MVEALADRVPDWIVFNEPHIFTTLGYLLGIHAPGRRDLDAFLRATHTVNLAQGEAVRAMRAMRCGAPHRDAYNMSPCEPATDSEADAAPPSAGTASRTTGSSSPRCAAATPTPSRTACPLARMGVEPRDMARVRADLDFIGINLYMRT